MNSPRHLFRAWDEFRTAVVQSKRAALFTDFDGTLVGLRRNPDACELPAGVARELKALLARGVLVGVVSGRSLRDLAARVRVPGAWLVGVHGFFLRSPGNRSFSALNLRKKVQMARVAGRLERLCRGLPGIRIEHKTASVAVHYRLAPAWARKAAAHAVQQVFASGRGLRRMDGKKIWELLPASRRDKWDAVSRIVRHEGRAARRGPNLVVYLGDDTTDEDVFHRLRGFTVAVGKRQGTAARYYLESPTEVRRFLERWNRLLS